MSQGYRYRPPGAKRTGRLQNREVTEAAALRDNLKKRKAQQRERAVQDIDGPNTQVDGDSKAPPNQSDAAVAKDAAKP